MSAKIFEFNATQPEGIPPQNIEAEESVLGGILFDAHSFSRVANILKADDFYITAHKHIYRAFHELEAKNCPIDVITVINWLTEHGLLETIGGRSKIAQLLDRSVSTVNIDNVASIIVSKSIRRQIIASGHELIRLGFDQKIEVEESLDAAESSVFEIRQGVEPSKNDLTSLADISAAGYFELDQLSQSGITPAINTGFYDFDSLMGGGFYPQDLIVLGGRPSMGKSLWSCVVAYEIAKKYQMPTVLFSLEMDKQSIWRRYLSSITEIESERLRLGKVSASEWEKIAVAQHELTSTPLFIDDSPIGSVLEIKSKVRRLMSQHGQLKLIAIDYLQMMTNGSDDRLDKQLGEITRQLKLLAKECNVPVLLLSQLNRSVESRTNKRPVMSDIRESGRVEEDADVVLFCYRDEYYNADTPDRGLMEIICTKHRNGPVGTVKLLFDGKYSRLRNYAR